MKHIFFSFIITLLTLPVLLFAQSTGKPAAPTSFKEIICIFVKIVLDFIPFVVVIAVGAFLTGLIKYVSHGDNEEKRSAGNKMMIYGIVGFFFMVSIWGILKIFVASFGLGDSFGVPQFAAQGGSFKATCQ